MARRRSHRRQPIDILFNKYLRGHPFLCRGVDLSPDGMRVRSFTEPDSGDESFSIELRLPGDDESLWVWARSVWRTGGEQAITFLAMADADRERLNRYVREGLQGNPSPP